MLIQLKSSSLVLVVISMQHANGDLQLFSQKTGQQWQNNDFYGVLLFDALTSRFP